MTPQRTCIGCRASLSPDTGVRVTRAADGSLLTGRANPGRGAWLCRSRAASCARAATKRKAWSRALRAEVGSGAVEDLVAHLTGAGCSVGGGTVQR